MHPTMSDVHHLSAQRAAARPDEPRAELSDLIVSRICHDLINPIGAIGNGIELLALTRGGETPEMRLIADSVANADALIRFFRVAYGAAAPGQAIAHAEVVATLRAAGRAGKVTYDWRPLGDQPRIEVRAVFLALQCCAKAMVHGGHVAVAKEGGTWALAAEGPRLQVDAALWSGLQATAARAPTSASLVQFALLPGAVADLGRPLALSLGPERIVVRF